MKCYGCFAELNSELKVCPHCGYVVGTKADESIFMDPGTKLQGRYTIGRAIGFGGFGVTYIGWDDVLEQRVAIKEYLPGDFSTRVPGQSQVKVFNGEKDEQFHDGMKEFIDEAKRLAKFQNEQGIVKIFDSFEENNTAYIIMEYLEGQTLTAYLKEHGIVEENAAVKMLMSVMESLKKMHAEGLLHRDIAPDNIFLTKDGEVKLIDFGAARYATTSHSRSLTVIIKPGYSPEEQYRSRSDQGPYTDVYALAATLYKMMTGITPPDALERRAKYETKSQDLLEAPKKCNKEISAVRDVALLNAMNVRIEDRTPDINSFIKELNADVPAKRVYGKLKKVEIYRWPVWVKVALVAAFAGIAIFGGLLGTGTIRFDSMFTNTVEVPDGMVVVPDVEGLNGEKAISKIENAGLTVVTEGNVESEYIEAGKIVLQNPSGKLIVQKGSEVRLTLSSGKQGGQSHLTDIPYVIWDTLDVAVAKIIAAGFSEPKIEYAFDNSVQEGQVISSYTYTIETGELKAGIVISKGPENTTSNDATEETTNPTTEKPKTDTEKKEHVHTWVDITKTVHHDAVVQQVWIEDPIEEYWYFDVSTTCTECGKVNSVTCGSYASSSAAENAYNSGVGRSDVDRLASAHKVAMGDSHKSSGYYASYWVETAGGGGHYEDKIVSDAYDEEVVTGQKCSTCGATK